MSIEREFDGMKLSFILDEVQRINEMVEYTEDVVGMAYFLEVSVFPNVPYCKIHLGGFILWDSEDERRDELDQIGYPPEPLGEYLQKKLKEHTRTANRLVEACAMLDTAEE